MWGSDLWGFWWIFPLLGMLLCLVCLLMAFRFASAGRGFMCMGGRCGMGGDEAGEASREIAALREEIRRLKASR